MRYKGTSKPLPEIAGELGVDAIVEGSVVRAGRQVRITAQLIHAASDTHLWAESYERELTTILSLQSEVAQAIAQAVQAKITPEEKRRLVSARPPINPAVERPWPNPTALWRSRHAARYPLRPDFDHGRIAPSPGGFQQISGVDLGFCFRDYTNVT